MLAFFFSAWLGISLVNPSVLTVNTVPESDLTSTTSIAAYVRQVQYENGLGDDFYDTLDCESRFVADAVGDAGRSFGVAQIFLVAHSNITKEQALDPRWAVNWTAREFKKGHQKQWTCWHQAH